MPLPGCDAMPIPLPLLLLLEAAPVVLMATARVASMRLLLSL